MATKLAALLVNEGISPDRAQLIAFKHVEFVRRDWGGGTVYIPIGAAHNADEMAREVYRRWDRTKIRELARELGISEMRLRQLHKIGARFALTDAQDDLPLDASDEDEPL